MEIEIKQYIIIRTDLGMSTGKLAAQATHAAKKIWFDKFKEEPIDSYDRSQGFEKKYSFKATEEEVGWIDGLFTTIVKKVKNENQLLKVYNQAKEAGLNCCIIEDAGLTELEGKNNTCIAIGPNYVEKCEPIVKRLRNLTNIDHV